MRGFDMRCKLILFLILVVVVGVPVVAQDSGGDTTEAQPAVESEEAGSAETETTTEETASETTEGAQSSPESPPPPQPEPMDPGPPPPGADIVKMMGKVEFRPPGAGWQPAEEGVRVPLEATISTGFKSSAVLDLGSSELFVSQLTRMTVLELADTGGEVSTSLFLDTGRIRADVKGASRDQLFQVQSPVATAAVRGTSFTFDGFKVQVLSGTVEFFNAVGERVTVSEGAASTVIETDAPTAPETEQAAETVVGVSTDPTAEPETPLTTATETVVRQPETADAAVVIQ